MREVFSKYTSKLFPHVGRKRNACVAVLLVSIAMLLRISGALGDTLWVDEAESAINGLTILETGLPKGNYLGIPVYENTLTEEWVGNEEYEYRDSSYSAKRNVAVYHGWLPLYAIAASQALFGIEPDRAGDSPQNQALHGDESVLLRTIAPRMPALVFSFLTCVCLFYLLRHIAGRTAALAGLTWFALSGKTAWFGTQARYYPLTLLMVTAVAYSFFRTVKWGNWASFIFLGLAEGLLFHTHQLSAVVFALAAVYGLPLIRQHAQWKRKCAVAAGIAGSMTIPWAIWSGFFETASQVPKVFYLFGGIYDWIEYGFEHPISLLVLVVLGSIIVGLFLFPRYVPSPCQEAFSAHRFYYLFLCYWMGLIYFAFHTLVPAASYFPDRLTLMLLMPFIMTLGLLIGDISRVIVKRWEGILAVGLSLLSIFLIHRPALFYGFNFDVTKTKQHRLNTYLAQEEFSEDVRFYTTPNEHLIFTYYTGLPVQSNIPVHRSFFETYPGEIVLLDVRASPAQVEDEMVLKYANEINLELTEDELTEIRLDLWRRMVYDADVASGMPVPKDMPQLSEFEASLLGVAQEHSEIEEAEAMEEALRFPIFNGVEVSSLDELWQIFFVRFIDYENRIGTKANYYSRIQASEQVHYLAAANLVIYRAPNPVVSPNHLAD